MRATADAPRHASVLHHEPGEQAAPGLHDAVARVIASRQLREAQVLDLGCGDGAMSERLALQGHSVVAVDRTPPTHCHVNVRPIRLDFDSVPFAEVLGVGAFDLAVAIEVIEHVENPLAFLRGITSSLKPTGIAIITTPNVDGFSSRLRFLRRGRLRAMAEGSDPTHISPVTWWLFTNRWLPAAGLRLVERSQFPGHGRVTSSSSKQLAYRLGARLTRTPVEHGTNHIAVVEPSLVGARVRMEK